jgi:hypothetical protein
VQLFPEFGDRKTGRVQDADRASEVDSQLVFESFQRRFHTFRRLEHCNPSLARPNLQAAGDLVCG